MTSDRVEPYRDSSGRTLAEYPRPSVAVDTAVLTLERGREATPALSVLEVRRPESRGWSLPGTFLHEGERLQDAVLRSLRDKAHVEGLHPHQLQVFDEPARDDRGWVLSVAHVDVVSADRLSSRLSGATRIVPIERPGRLPYGHNDMIRHAVFDVRARYASMPDPDRLLPQTFTLRELRLVHEAIAGKSLQRDTFRRAMEPHLTGTGTMTSGARGRPAELFQRR